MGTQPVSPPLPSFAFDAPPAVEPALIVDKRVIYRHGSPLTQGPLYIQWTHCHLDSNTWEYLLDLLTQFPQAARLLSIS